MINVFCGCIICTRHAIHAVVVVYAYRVSHCSNQHRQIEGLAKDLSNSLKKTLGGKWKGANYVKLVIDLYSSISRGFRILHKISHIEHVSDHHMATWAHVSNKTMDMIATFTFTPVKWFLILATLSAQYPCSKACYLKQNEDVGQTCPFRSASARPHDTYRCGIRNENRERIYQLAITHRMHVLCKKKMNIFPSG